MPKSLDKILIIVIAFIFLYQIQRSFNKIVDYQCGSCGESFSLSSIQAVIAPHRFGGQKLVKCPECGIRSWATPVAKD